MKFSFGSDPEFMVTHNGKIKSAINFLKGSRDNRQHVGEFSFYYDNVLAECTIKPAHSKEEAVNNIRQAIELFKEVLSPAELTIKPSHVFEDKELDTGQLVLSPLGEMVMEGRYAGCKEEKCAYECSVIEPEDVQIKIKNNNLRTAGGHIHIGLDDKKYTTAVSIIRMMDLFLGIPSLTLDQNEHATNRRELYGLPGRFRQPKWGVEYRTLSNFWLKSPKLVELFYDLTEFSVNFVSDQKHEEFWTIDEEKIESDDFWNSGGDPADLHVCHGYDVESLKKCFVDKNESTKPFTDILKSVLPTELNEKLCQIECGDNLYDEWQIN